MYGSKSEIEQPKAYDTALTNQKRYVAGSQRSQKRLTDLNYDPIGELVKQYHRLQECIDEELKYKSGELVKLSLRDGKPLMWRPDALHRYMDQAIVVAEKLLRYGYGRVPEINVTENRSLPPLIVQTTAKGEIYHTSGDEDETDEMSS
jgi:hypothetical protein